MSESDIETLYSPSAWSKRLSREVIVEQHIKITKAYSEETRKNVKCQLNLKYGPEEENIYDIFGIDLEEGAPIFIHIHGGYWQEQSITRELYWFIASNLHKNGIKTIFIEYELCPKVNLSTISDSIHKAITECLKYAESCNTKELHLCGHSAGAHLAVQLFENVIPNLPQASRNLFKTVFLISGIYNLVPLVPTTINGPLGLNKQSAIASSPLLQKITGGETEFYVIAAQDDSPSFVEQAEQMKEHLIKSKLKTKYVCLENIDHFDIIENLFDEGYELTKFIIDKVKRSPS